MRNFPQPEINIEKRPVFQTLKGQYRADISRVSDFQSHFSISSELRPNCVGEPTAFCAGTTSMRCLWPRGILHPRTAAFCVSEDGFCCTHGGLHFASRKTAFVAPLATSLRQNRTTFWGNLSPRMRGSQNEPQRREHLRTPHTRATCTKITSRSIDRAIPAHIVR